MILLDTNVISELMRLHPDETVLTWVDGHTTDGLFISAITEAEILQGIALLPAGKRRDALAKTANAMIEKDFADHCLPFNSAAARQYAELTVHRTRIGRPISVEDAQIAAIALCCEMTLATRNTRDFANIPGLTVLNPWLHQ